MPTSSYCPPVRPSDWFEPETDSDWLAADKPLNDAQWKLALIDEIVAKALTSAEHVALELRFREQADKWERETSHVSSLTKRVMHPSYQTIIGMGPDVIPLLLRDLQKNRRDWFWALQHLTEANPVDTSDAGKLDRMIEAWVNWARERDLL